MSEENKKETNKHLIVLLPIIFTVAIIIVSFILGIGDFFQFTSQEKTEKIDDKVVEEVEVKVNHNWCTDCALPTPFPPEWCDNGEVIETEPVYYEEKDCYCPAPPTCKVAE